MIPEISNTSFGSITIENKEYDFDILINLKGQVSKRKKKLSKAIYGTSHTLSKEEVKYVYENKAQEIIIGTGQYGRVELSDEASEYLRKQHCDPILMPTPDAIQYWNNHKGKAVGLFHITC